MITLPFTIVTLRGFIAAIPPELEEAAQVDGCTRRAAFRRVVFPLLAPGLMSTSLFGFITAWNEFAFANALIIKNQDDRTLPVWLSSFSNVFGTDWGATMAASTLFMLPGARDLPGPAAPGHLRVDRRRGEGINQRDDSAAT